MAAILTDNAADVLEEKDVRHVINKSTDCQTELIELGIWLSGLQSYLGTGLRLIDHAGDQPREQYAAAEFRIAHAGLKRCVLILSKALAAKTSLGPQGAPVDGFSSDELSDLSELLYDAVMISESLVNSTVQGPSQWRAWSRLMVERFEGSAVFLDLIRRAEMNGAVFVPQPLAELGYGDRSLTPEQAELVLVLPRFGIVLKWLSVVKAMLDRDEPLKPSLLIFSRVNELILDLTSYINSRLTRSADPGAELFATLDAAAYTASIELKKVYSQELAGVASMRPAPSIYARIETAYALLNDGFQQILAGFMRNIDTRKDIFDLFPEFRVKLDQSLELRSELWSVSRIVKQAEAAPDTAQIDKMKQALQELRQGPIKYLFYKDTETVERFIEEIRVTSQNKDLVPILHRFGAFLDTLFGQVSLRSVLENFPFEPSAGE